jgi:hypothetical protein
VGNRSTVEKRNETYVDRLTDQRIDKRLKMNFLYIVIEDKHV